MEKARFENEKRNRYYGLRRGDTIECAAYNKGNPPKGEVVEFGFMDNNRVYVLFEGEETERSCVAEWCKINKK